MTQPLVDDEFGKIKGTSAHAGVDEGVVFGSGRDVSCDLEFPIFREFDGVVEIVSRKDVAKSDQIQHVDVFDSADVAHRIMFVVNSVSFEESDCFDFDEFSHKNHLRMGEEFDQTGRQFTFACDAIKLEDEMKLSFANLCRQL